MVIGQGAVPDRAMRKQIWGSINGGDQALLGGAGKTGSGGRRLRQGFVFCLLKIEGIGLYPFALAENRVRYGEWL